MTNSTTVATAVIQLTSVLYDSKANRQRSLEVIGEAADAGARLIVLPELMISGYGLDADGLRSASEPVDGPTLEAWCALARHHDIWIAGGICERDGDRLHNSAILVGPDGLAGHYRKLHLFSREKTVFAPGDLGLPVIDTAVGRIGLCVCYDLRFVEVMRALALQGAGIIAVPTAWVGGFDRNPRDEMGFIGQARGAMVQANLNQVFVACASQGGEAGGIRFLGSSLIIDPYGQVLAGPMGEAETGMLVEELDLEELTRAQERTELVHPRADRRTDVYDVTVAGRPAAEQPAAKRKPASSSAA